MLPRRTVIGFALVAAGVVSGCGWTPLYANRETGPGDVDLRAIRVAPITDRVGQRLELALRDSLNPSGVPTPQRYVLSTTLQTTLADLGIQSQGLASRGQVDVVATYTLKSIETGKMLLSNTVHVNDSFNIAANGYANVVAEDDARTRAVEELREEIIARLTMFMQRRRIDPASADS
jgi:LPS-assembly lipoprotein